MATRGVNLATVLGRVGRDPEMRKTKNDTSVVNLSIATKEIYKDKQKVEHEDTDWHNAVFYDKLADIVHQYVAKGDRIFIQGRMKTRQWTDQNDIKRWTTEIIVTKLELLGTPKATESGAARDSDPEPPPASESSPEDPPPYEPPPV